MIAQKDALGQANKLCNQKICLANLIKLPLCSQNGPCGPKTSSFGQKCWFFWVQKVSEHIFFGFLRFRPFLIVLKTKDSGASSEIWSRCVRVHYNESWWTRLCNLFRGAKLKKKLEVRIFCSSPALVLVYTDQSGLDSGANSAIFRS